MAKYLQKRARKPVIFARQALRQPPYRAAYVDRRKMTCWGVKCIGESDSAGNCKFPKPSGATILLDPTRSFLF